MDKKLMHEKITKLLEDEPDLNIDEAINIIVEEAKNDKIRKEEPRLIKKSQTCKNFWCKSPFNVEFYEGENFPKTCPKCESFKNELSGGIESSEKKYDGSRHDGLPHEVKFHFSEYNQSKGFWNK